MDEDQGGDPERADAVEVGDERGAVQGVERGHGARAEEAPRDRHRGGGDERGEREEGELTAEAAPLRVR